MTQPLRRDEVWNMGSDVLCQKLLDTHNLIHNSRNELEFQIANISITKNQYYDQEKYLAITLMSPPGKHRIYVKDFRHKGIGSINPYLPTCYLSVLIRLSHVSIHEKDSIHGVRYTVPFLNTSEARQFISTVNSKGKFLESFWPTYDINEGVHLCQVQRHRVKTSGHKLIPDFSTYSCFEASDFLDYLAGIWTSFWNSTFTYTEQGISKRAFRAAKISPSVQAYEVTHYTIEPTGRYRAAYGYDCMSLLITASEKNISWNRYPHMSRYEQKILSQHTGLTENIVQSKSRYLAVKKQIQNISIPKV